MNLDAVDVILRFSLGAQQINPDIPKTIRIATTFTEKMATIKDEVIADPHDFLVEILLFDNEMGSVSRAVSVDKVFPFVISCHVIKQSWRQDYDKILRKLIYILTNLQMAPAPCRPDLHSEQVDRGILFRELPDLSS